MKNPKTAQKKKAAAKLLSRAIALHKNGNLGGAGRLYKKILDNHPDHPDALHNLGVIAANHKFYNKALPRFKRALEVDPNQVQYWLSYIECLIKAGKIEAAAQIFDKACSFGLEGDAAENLRRRISQLIEVNREVQALGKLEDQEAFSELAARAEKLITRYGKLPALLQYLGTAWLYTGKEEEALSCFEKLLQETPDDVLCLNIYGVGLNRTCQFKAAERIYGKALALDPQNADIMSNMGANFNDAKQYEKSLDCLTKALEINPASYRVQANLANAYMGLGRNEEAEQLFEKLLLKDNTPSQVIVSYATLICYTKTKIAIRMLKQALAKKPEYPEALAVLGKSYNHNGEPEKALECYDTAISLKADYEQALIYKAELLCDQGEFEQARKLFNSVLSFNASNIEALIGLSRSQKMKHSDRSWLEQAKRFSETDITVILKASLFYAMGKFCDDTKNYDDAFSYYSEANRLRKATISPYKARNHEGMVTHFITVYTKGLMASAVPQVDENTSEKPLFILGLPRSGTSLTEQIIAAHPETFGAGELRFFGDNAKAHEAEVSAGKFQKDHIASMGREYLNLLNRFSPESLRVVDKMPGNFMWIGLIHAVFPNAKIIHTMRNPVDTCLSIFFQDFNFTHTYATDLENLAHYCRHYLRLMTHWRQVLSKETLLEVPYEALLEDQESWSRRIIDFIGLEWDDACMQFYKTKRKVGTASNWQTRQPIYKSSKERWRNYEKYVDPLIPLLKYYDPERGQLPL